MRVIETVLESKRSGNRKPPARSKSLKCLPRLLMPAMPTNNRQRSLGAVQQLCQLCQMLIRRGCLRSVIRAGVWHFGFRHQHIFGQYHHYRPGSTIHRRMKSAADNLRHSGGILNLLNCLDHVGKQNAVLNFLERFATRHVSTNLPHEKNQRSRILRGNMYA